MLPVVKGLGKYIYGPYPRETSLVVGGDKGEVKPFPKELIQKWA